MAVGTTGPASGGRLHVRNLGPVLDADVEFGDLTVLVGPQASGKSIFLQTLKLVLDRNHVHDTFKKFGSAFGGDARAFLGGYFGRGMGGMIDSEPAPTIEWQDQTLTLEQLAKRKTGRGTTKGTAPERLFYIPAQRVVSLPGGASRPFTAFNYGDPYALRYFADRVHFLLQTEFGDKKALFPQPNRLNDTLRRPISDNLLGGARLVVDVNDFTRTITLKPATLTEGLSFLAWSAGQREFLPLLLGFYWLCPAGAVSRREEIEWVVIEEPEMGLHPQAICTLLLMVLELMRRGYRVAISTHSPVVLDLVWTLRTVRDHNGQEEDLRQLFSLKRTAPAVEITTAALKKRVKVYFFQRGKATQDISALDPSSSSPEEAYWGDLLGFSSRASKVVADVLARDQTPSAAE